MVYLFVTPTGTEERRECSDLRSILRQELPLEEDAEDGRMPAEVRALEFSAV